VLVIVFASVNVEQNVPVKQTATAQPQNVLIVPVLDLIVIPAHLKIVYVIARITTNVTVTVIVYAEIVKGHVIVVLALLAVSKKERGYAVF
jgi:hypothetical protein